MKTRSSRACAVCKSSRRATIENAIRRRQSAASIANSYGLGRASIRTHAAKHMPLASSTASAAPIDGQPALLASHWPAAATPLERARLNADEALAALRTGERAELPVSDLTKLRNALTGAEKLYAQLARERDLSAEEILKTKAWDEVLDRLVRLLKPYPDAARAVMEGLQG